MKANKILLLVSLSFFLASCNSNQSDSQVMESTSHNLPSQTEETTSPSNNVEEEGTSVAAEVEVIDISPIPSIEELVLGNDNTELTKQKKEKNSMPFMDNAETKQSSSDSSTSSDEFPNENTSDEASLKEESVSDSWSDESKTDLNNTSSSLDSTLASDIDYAQYDSVDQVIEDLIIEYGFESSQLGIVFTNLITGETYELNSDQVTHAASTNKVGTSVLYVDLINQGLLEWDSMIPFSDSYVEEGGGEITNNPFESSYSVEDLLYNCLVYSDNTAWNMLINYYYSNFGDFQANLVSLSNIQIVSDELYNLNYASPRMLNEILMKVAINPQYEQLVQYMSLAQPGQRFRLYVDDGMATKYGMYDTGYHDTGIYFDSNGQPIYTLVLMSHDLGMIDLFMGDLNLRVYEWTYYNLAS